MFGLIPREKIFFDLFERLASNVSKSAVEFGRLMSEYTDVHGKAAKIKEIEHAGDELTHRTIQHVNKTFVTPIDREDIHELVCRLDDILDLIDDTVSRMVMYKIEKPTEHAKKLANVLVQATDAVERAVKSLRNMRKSEEILKLCVQIHTYENEGDRIEKQAIADLFNTTKQSSVEIIKWKDIYEVLEDATDKCEDVANVLEGIVLKNA